MARMFELSRILEKTSERKISGWSLIAAVAVEALHHRRRWVQVAVEARIRRRVQAVEAVGVRRQQRREEVAAVDLQDPLAAGEGEAWLPLVLPLQASVASTSQLSSARGNSSCDPRRDL